VFDLRTSPFYLLGVSPRDNRAIIAQATETAITEGALDEAVATRAQQILMSPRLRLGAELSWLLGLAPNRTRQLIDETTPSREAVAGLPLLAGANLAAHRCSTDSSPAYHALLFRFYEQRDDNDILHAVNSERKAANFPEVPLDLLQEVMPDLTQQHTSAFIEFITREPCPGGSLLAFLHENFADGSKAIGFLDNIAERFDDWAAGSFQRAEEAITGALTKIEEKPTTLNQHLPVFSAAIGEWASIAAPHQFILARRHINDPRTEQLLGKIRSVCLRLNNELGDPKTPLALTKAALPAFEGSPGHFELANADLKTLEQRVADHDAFKLIEPLHNFISGLNNKHREIGASLRKGNFKKDGNGYAGDLFRLFEKSAVELAGMPAKGAPFRLLLSLAIDLHNQSSATEEALILVRALQAFRDVPKEDDVVENLEKNGIILYHSALQKNLAAAVQGKRFRRCARIAQELAASATDEEERAGWEKLRIDFDHRSVKQGLSYGGSAIAVIVVIIMASMGDRTPSRNYPANPTTSQSPTYSDQASVVVPAPGSGVLSPPELRWCLLEIDRLKRIRQIAGESPTDRIADAWNTRQTYWTERCADKQYYKKDHDVAERFVQTSATTLQSEAQAIYASWSQPTSPRTSPATPPASTPKLVPGRPR
jgi:hypothetical protein